MNVSLASVRPPVAVAALWLAPTFAVGQEPSADRAAEGYAANRAGFTQFTCRYVVRKGTAEVAGGGRSLNWRDVQEARGLWARDGDRERVSLGLSDAAAERVEDRLAEPPSDPGPASADGSRLSAVDEPFTPEDYLTNGREELRHGTGIANIFADMGGGGHAIDTPFSMGVMGFGETMNPAAVIGMARSRNLPVEAAETPGGLIEVRLPEDENGNGMAFTFDPERGFLPVVIEFRVRGRAEDRTEILDAAEFDGRWFPIRCVSSSNPDGGGVKFVTEYEVTELTMGAPPDGAFEVTLPEGTNVTDLSVVGGTVSLPAAEAYTPETLPAALTRAAMRASGRETPLALVEHVEANRLPTWLWAAAAAVAAGLVAVLLLRRRGAAG